MNNKPSWIARAALKFLGLDGQLSLQPNVINSLGATASGKFVTVDSALQLSAVFACVRLVSETVSTLPIKLYKTKADGSSELAKDHPLYKVLCKSPNYEMTTGRFWLFTVASIMLWGNAYVEITRGPNKRVISIDPLLPQNMVVQRNKTTKALEYFYTEDGVRRQINEKDMMHIRAFGIDGVMGVFTINKGRETFGTAMSAEQAAGKFFENGLQTSGFLSTEQKLSDSQRKQIHSHLAKFVGSTNAGKMMVLEHGMEYNGITMNPEAAQMLETRSFEIEEICRWFRVPPFMIGHFDKQSSWSSSAEAQDLNFMKYSLRPLLVNIEQEISRCLIGRFDAEDYYASFNVEGLLRADSKTRSEYYASALDHGWMNRNDVRQKENLPPIDGGDQYTIQSALIPLDKVGTNYDGGKESE
ncbi:phage portal protein [Acinetobacter ursingii]|uniref:phage portal protein n=1 Tax=Acinetobacter ursingii TaxID=108980 RepID=UPI00124F2539|nr:phage portal protein [Acinetobacter ursingii]